MSRQCVIAKYILKLANKKQRTLIFKFTTISSSSTVSPSARILPAGTSVRSSPSSGISATLKSALYLAGLASASNSSVNLAAMMTIMDKVPLLEGMFSLTASCRF